MGSTSNDAYIGEPLSAVLANEDTDYLETWKSSLNFTGQNPVFPVEMFIVLMEEKYSIENNPNCNAASKCVQSKECTNILEHIYDDDGTPASYWKRRVLSQNDITKLSWTALKKDLFKHFGQQKRKHGNFYTMYEKLLLLNSLVKGSDEQLATFCVRVNVVTTILQHGKFCWTLKPSQDWVKILFLFGLAEDERNLIIQDADNVHNLKDLCLFINEKKRCSEMARFNLPNITDIEQKQTDYENITTIKEESSSSQDDEINTQEANSSLVPNHSASLAVSMEDDGKELDKNYIKEETPEYVPIDTETWTNTDKVDCVSSIKKSKHKRSIKEKHNKCNEDKRKIKTQSTTCFLCDQSFANLSLLKEHYGKNHPESEPTKCPMCDFCRMDRRLVIVHLQRNHVEQSDKKPFICPVQTCNKSFRRNDQLNAHKRLSHEGGQKYQCHLCGHRCDYKKRLQEHINAIHTKEKPFKCEKCSFATSWRTQLTQHLWCVHGEGKGSTYTCDLCGYSTKRQGKYKNHLMNLHNIGVRSPAMCSICGRSFKTKNYLMDHMYKVHKKTMAGKDTKAALKEKGVQPEIAATQSLGTTQT